MTIADPRSDKARKVEPASPETPRPVYSSFLERVIDRAPKDGISIIPGEDYDPMFDAYRSWLLAIDELHALTMRLLKDDHA